MNREVSITITGANGTFTNSVKNVKPFKTQDAINALKDEARAVGALKPGDTVTASWK